MRVSPWYWLKLGVYWEVHYRLAVAVGIMMGLRGEMNTTIGFPVVLHHIYVCTKF